MPENAPVANKNGPRKRERVSKVFFHVEPPKLLERDITKAIKDWLDARGIWYYKHFQASRRGRSGRKGVADLICGIPPNGRWLAIEVKRPGAKPSEDQVQFLEDVRRIGGIAILAYSVDDVIQVFKALGLYR